MDFETAIRGSGLTLPLVLSGKEPSRQRAPGKDGDAQFQRGRNMLTFDIALDEGILELQGGNPFAGLLLGQRLCARHVPGGNIGEADVTNLPCLYERVERRENFLDRRNHIPRVHPVEINVIRL